MTDYSHLPLPQNKKELREYALRAAKYLSTFPEEKDIYAGKENLPALLRRDGQILLKYFESE